jgi:cell division septation protein DedD
MDVPNQDKLIYDRMAAKNGEQQPERLLPPPETAQSPPAPENVPAPGPAPAAAPAVPPPSMTAPSPGSAMTAALPPRASTAPAASAPMPAPVPKSQPAPQPAPQPVAKPAPAPAPSPAAAPAAAKAGGGWVVQLGAVHSEAEAKTEWNRLTGQHHQLASLSADIVRVDIPGKGVFWRVRGGPLDEAAARVLCSDLTKQGQGCLVARK